MTAQWTSLDPWDKAARWLKVAPELSADIVEMAKDQAHHAMEIERQRALLDDDLRRREAAHRELMDRRLWWTQMTGVALNFICLMTLVVVAIRVGDESVLAAISVLGAGGGVTAASWGVSAHLRRTFQGSFSQEESSLEKSIQ
ncbi:hypothetical protein ABZ783_33910 [Micromonospora sp. NPDC047738]|uniref:hypothetical protein n=1 Tax=Micromonospora sp. NPDC047738 TaxID=3155741 RepID=UPI0033F34AFE